MTQANSIKARTNRPRNTQASNSPAPAGHNQPTDKQRAAFRKERDKLVNQHAEALSTAYGDVATAKFAFCASVIMQVAARKPGGYKSAGGSGNKNPFKEALKEKLLHESEFPKGSVNKLVDNAYDFANGVLDSKTWAVEGLRDIAADPDATVETVTEALGEAEITRVSHFDKRRADLGGRARKNAGSRTQTPSETTDTPDEPTETPESTPETVSKETAKEITENVTAGVEATEDSARIVAMCNILEAIHDYDDRVATLAQVIHDCDIALGDLTGAIDAIDA